MLFNTILSVIDDIHINKPNLVIDFDTYYDWLWIYPKNRHINNIKNRFEYLKSDSRWTPELDFIFKDI